MNGIDRYAYRSALGAVNPVAKLCLSLLCGALCLCLDRISVSALTLVLCVGLVVRCGGVPLRAVCGLFVAPIGIIALGAITVAVQPMAADAALCGASLFGTFWGVSVQSLTAAAGIFLRALGSIACVYFSVLTTPMPDVLQALRCAHVPQLLLSLGELMYRFVFVFDQSARRIRRAQVARLGGMRLRAFGELVGMIWMKAYRKSDRIAQALEARGFDGTLRMLPRTYESGRKVWCLAAGVIAAQLAVYFLERGVRL